MRTAVMTDSNSGITEQEAQELGIFLLPMQVIIEDEIHYEGQDLTQESFYQSLTSGKNITTSQPSPGDVIAMWEKILQNGYDQVVHIPMSSGLSNSCETAISLSDEYEGRVCVVDNHRISVPMRESVLDAVEMAKEGKTAEEIRKKLEDTAYDASIYIAVDTLEFLKKGGRVTPAGAALGAVLSIKPILTIQGDKLDAFAKVRGMKKCRHKMIEAIREEMNTRFADVERSRLVIGTAGAGLSREEEEQWKNEVADAFPQMAVYYNPLSVSIECHLGPGAMGIAVCVNNRKD